MEPAMTPSLPTLAMLRGFECAAQHLSFTRAADDLGLTQTAISHMIRKLEGIVGQPLFERDGNRLRLTRAGKEYLPVARSVIESVTSATERLREQAEFSVLTISSVLSFSVKWLMPRLPEFARAYPDIRLQVGANVHLDDTLAPDADVAILYGSGNWPDLVATRLFEEWVTPVCSPDLIARGPALASPGDLGRHRLLRTSFYFRYRDDWQPWLAAAGLNLPRDQQEMAFDLHYSALEAARLGLGVAIGRTPLVSDDLRSGRLVAPFDGWIKSQQNYYLAARPGVTRTPKYRAFRDWIRDAAANESDRPEGSGRSQ
jgi:LysR family transcriptional regulator, glycine cleavage system transcriptional activator